MRKRGRNYFLPSTFIIIGMIHTNVNVQIISYPDPANNPESSLMLAGDWVPTNTIDIDFSALPLIPSEHSIVSDVRDNDAPGYNYSEKYAWDQKMSIRGGVNQHNYLTFYDGKIWIMWSDGPAVEDHIGQVVKYATSSDGVTWTKPAFLTGYPPGSGPDSPHYGDRSDKGFRYIARGFWIRSGKLLALTSIDEADGFFGHSLKLMAFRWNLECKKWEDYGLVSYNAISNFPPKKLPTGSWMMSRRTFDYKETGVQFMVGGTEAIDEWESYPVFGSATELDAEEPYWWVLPDKKSLMALFRDNRGRGYLYRSFSLDNGRTWSRIAKTNFPDARSKFHGIRLSDGRYVLASNPNPQKRDPLVLSISEDGMVFTKMGYLTGGRHIDYPHVMEHEGFLYVAFAGSVKQMIEVLKIRISDLNGLDMSFMKGRKSDDGQNNRK